MYRYKWLSRCKYTSTPSLSLNFLYERLFPETFLFLQDPQNFGVNIIKSLNLLWLYISTLETEKPAILPHLWILFASWDAFLRTWAAPNQYLPFMTTLELYRYYTSLPAGWIVFKQKNSLTTKLNTWDDKHHLDCGLGRQKYEVVGYEYTNLCEHSRLRKQMQLYPSTKDSLNVTLIHDVKTPNPI